MKLPSEKIREILQRGRDDLTDVTHVRAAIIEISEMLDEIYEKDNQPFLPQTVRMNLIKDENGCFRSIPVEQSEKEKKIGNVPMTFIYDTRDNKRLGERDKRNSFRE